jgi:hypothetical protein
MYLDGVWCGYRFIENNTFIEVLNEDVIFRRRRNSAPELIWRYSFSPPGLSMAPTASIGSCETATTTSGGSENTARRISIESIGSSGTQATSADCDDDDDIRRRLSATSICSSGTKITAADSDDEISRRVSTASVGSYGHAETASSVGSVDGGRSWSGVCKLMIKNIPCSCTKKDFAKLVAERGFMKVCTSFFIPSRNDKILGYAFIEFPYPLLAEAFAKCFHGFKVPRVHSKKVLSIVPASIQGPDSNVSHFKSNGVMNTESIFRGRSESSIHHASKCRGQAEQHA